MTAENRYKVQWYKSLDLFEEDDIYETARQERYFIPHWPDHLEEDEIYRAAYRDNDFIPEWVDHLEEDVDLRSAENLAISLWMRHDRSVRWRVFDTLHQVSVYETPYQMIEDRPIDWKSEGF